LQAAGGMVGDTAEHVDQPSLRVDVDELGRGDQRVHRRCTLAAAVGPGDRAEIARLPSAGDAHTRVSRAGVNQPGLNAPATRRHKNSRDRARNRRHGSIGDRNVRPVCEHGCG
jgi:hypothetical protein